MKVVIVGSNGFDTLEYHFADSFRRLGHEVTILDLTAVMPIKYDFSYHAIRYIRWFDEYIFRNLAKKVIALSPDLVIGTYRFINPLCIRMIRSALPNVPLIHINPDALTTFEHQQVFASAYDFFFTKDPYIVSFMKQKMGLNAVYLPEAFNPAVHRKPDGDRFRFEEESGIDVLAFGHIYPYRARIMKRIIDAGIKVTLFGKRDKRFSTPEIDKHFRNEWITGEVKSRLLYGAKIVFNNLHFAEIESVNCKFFEISGIGAFQICDFRPIISEYSKIDVAKFTFKSIDEAIDSIKYYVDKPTVRHEMAGIQYDHFIQHHTYDHRVKQIIATVFK
jgi:spore maturation protein CgeB